MYYPNEHGCVHSLTATCCKYPISMAPFGRFTTMMFHSPAQKLFNLLTHPGVYFLIKNWLQSFSFDGDSLYATCTLINWLVPTQHVADTAVVDNYDQKFYDGKVLYNLDNNIHSCANDTNWLVCAINEFPSI